MNKYFLTIDNGGTNTKAVIFDTDGKQVSESSFPTMRIEEKSGFHEIDLNELWAAIGCAIKKTISIAGIESKQIIGVSCVGHGKGLYVLDRNKHIFMHGILSTDSRAIEIARRFEKQVDTIFPISHQHVMESQSPVLLNWLKKNQPQNYDQIGFVLAAKDFVRFKLTGNVFQEYGDASGNNFINLDKKNYDQRLFDFFEISEIYHKMPELKKFSDLCGYITSESSQETGLTIGTPVFGGLFDIDACSLATGVLNNDFFSIIAGTWNINVFPSTKIAPATSGLMNSLYPTGDFLVESSSATSAGNLSITINNLLDEETKNAQSHGKSIYDVLEEFLSHTGADFSKVIFFPFLYGSNVDPNAEGAYIGVQSDTSKSAMIRSVYEGIIFAHKYHISKLIETSGCKPKAIRLSGGGTNSSSWVQMFANVLETPVETVADSELGGLGGAIASSIGTNYYANIDQAVSHMVHLKDKFLPDNQQSVIYRQKYEVYLKLLTALDGSWSSLKNMQRRISQS
ncbi:carbohydrate kinase [Oenococcus sicerae]|uniref:Carbohydrate kinase n=1 Tax=Oenococcus sicerae TaxID=2203724 RepID=A0AAJ1VML7_9LACO|nr:FGGY-family carbohydrate kinase [Oenococcus sicerae]MDN6900698.1 carbohydrate kinase [Oenococcus sicerae]QAS69300.1 carbohydrate kinase [Oenococcus sicerae]